MDLLLNPEQVASAQAIVKADTLNLVQKEHPTQKTNGGVLIQDLH